MEKGNFVHECWSIACPSAPRRHGARDARESAACTELLHEVFDETLAEHAGKRGTGPPLLPLLFGGGGEVAEILPQLEGVLASRVRGTCPLCPRATRSLRSTSRVEYAGWPRRAHRPRKMWMPRIAPGNRLASFGYRGV